MTFTSRIDNNPLTPLFSLGKLCVSDFIPLDDNIKYPKQELKVCLDEISGLVQLEQSTDLDQMYRKYWYNSGTNPSMVNHLNDIVLDICKNTNFKIGDKWLDIASNDGTLLSKVPSNLIKVGCDPSDCATRSQNGTFALVNDYFSSAVSSQFGKFKVITAIAMFYDLNDPLSFLKDIYNSLTDDGLFVIELSYLPLMIEQLAFDAICHEHVCFYSLEVLNRLYKRSGLTIVNAQINDCNGGSIRVYAQKDIADKSTYGTEPYRSVAKFRISSIYSYEQTYSLKDKEVYDNFFFEINELKTKTVNFIHNVRAKGKSVAAIGASTKGNTLLQYFGLDNNYIDYIAERQPMKYGLKTVGTNIPIISDEEMRKRNPDYLLVLPWHFISEFKKREKDYLDRGGKFIVPCPNFEIV